MKTFSKIARARKYLLWGLTVAALLAGAAVVRAQSRSSKDDTLAKLQKAARAYHAVPDAKRTPVHDPRKFSDPIGVDAQGRPFPVTK